MLTRNLLAAGRRVALASIVPAIAVGTIVSPLAAQGRGAAMEARPVTNNLATEAKAARITIPLESAVTTQHTATIKGKRVPYKATAGTLPVYNIDGQPVASVFYVYYERTDVTDKARRPLSISFNGGPGSSSAWMHLGYTGPKRVRIDDEGNPVQPYGVRDNPESIIDVTDIVFVDPVNVGLSRPVEGADRSQFFGVNQDIDYLGRWIELFVTRQGRWNSPKFLIGESYGTTRVSGLSARLQSTHKMYLNGVILVSPTGLGIDRAGPVRDALTLPHYAATAWYHGQLAQDLQSKDLEAILPEVERFTIDEYIPALARGGFLGDAERRAVAGKVARYAGVSEGFVLNNNLAIPINHWRKELLRDQRLTVGRLDARYQGVDRDAAGISYDYDPAMSAWNHSFAPAINHYLREDLGYKTDLVYHLIGGPVQPWDRTNDRTGENLRRAMAENPYLKTMVQAGYYDGGTDYFSAKYTMWHIDPSGQLKDRFRFRLYRSGHMMYLRDEDLVTSNQDIRDFIEWATPAEGAPAHWGRRRPVT
jgi:carboxypeptidase C (cathepsin A)